MQKPLKILVVNDVSDRASAIRQALGEQGFDEVSIASPDIHLPDTIELFRPDVILIDAESDARDILEHVVVANQHKPRPLVLCTLQSDQETVKAAISAGVSAYVAADLSTERIAPVLEVAVARFEAEQALKEELTRTKTQLAERRLVDKAKGVLMDTYHLSEEEAYSRLRQIAMDQGLRLGQVARRIIDSAAV